MNQAPFYRAAGIVTLIFAACPTVELGLMTVAESEVCTWQSS